MNTYIRIRGRGSLTFSLKDDASECTKEADFVKIVFHENIIIVVYLFLAQM